MKRIKSIFILGLLSLFLGGTTVTGNAQSNAATVEAGITFVEDDSSGTIPDSNESAVDPESDTSEQTEESTAKESEGRLPQTGEQSSFGLTIIGLLCLGLLFYLTKRSFKKEK